MTKARSPRWRTKSPDASSPGQKMQDAGLDDFIYSMRQGAHMDFIGFYGSGSESELSIYFLLGKHKVNLGDISLPIDYK